MTRRMVRAVAITICALIATPAAAQSLGELARREEARRASEKRAVRTFTNADLPTPELPASSTIPSAVDCYVSRSQDKCVAPDEMVANSTSAVDADPQVKTSEDVVRQQSDRIRQRLATVQEELEAISTAADDESRSPGERAAAARMAAQRDTLLNGIERQWLALEKLVADEGLPREWLGAIPVLSTRNLQ